MQLQYLGSVMVSKGFDLESFNKNKKHPITGWVEKRLGLSREEVICGMLHRPSDPINQLDIFSKVPVAASKVKEFILH